MNESAAIITSMNLYEFSQVNNNEMGVYIERDVEPELYRDTYEEAQRLIRVSEEIRLAAETVEKVSEADEQGVAESEGQGYGKLSTSRLARERKLSTVQLLEQLVVKGFLNLEGEKHILSDAGKAAGGEFQVSKRFGPYFLWPVDLAV